MTAQLKKEQDTINTFQEFCRDNNIRIVHKYESSENKAKNTDSDFDIEFPNKKIKSVSLKSAGGQMAHLNAGAGSRSASKWMSPEEVELIKEAEKEMQARRKSVSSKYARWDEIENSEELKYFVIEPLYEAWFFILSSTIDAVKRLSYYISGRKSDYLFVENKFIPYTVFSGTEVSKINSKSILVGNCELRFKTEGGKTSSSIKVNVSFKK